MIVKLEVYVTMCVLKHFSPHMWQGFSTIDLAMPSLIILNPIRQSDTQDCITSKPKRLSTIIYSVRINTQIVVKTITSLGFSVVG